MKYMFLILCFVSGLVSCDTEQKWIDTGISSPYFEGTMMEYLRSDSYNWKLTVVMIERAGLTDMFEGRMAVLPEITFFAPPSYTILRYLWDNKMETVDEMSVEACKEMILRHVVKGKYLKKNIAFRNQKYPITSPLQDGGTSLTTLNKGSLKAYVDKSSYEGVPDVGPQTLYLHSFTAHDRVPLATPDIQPTNGVVHALNYNYVLGNI